MRKWLNGFAGEIPQSERHLLPDAAAQVAQNVDLSNGSILPRRQSLVVNTPTKAGTKLTIYRFGKDLDSDTQYWFHWLADTSVCRGPIPNDATERTFYTERGQPPKETDNTLALSGGGTDYPNNSYLLGLPQAAPCAAAVSGSPLAGETTASNLRVTYTYVNSFGEEGPPATAPSNAVDWLPGQSLDVTGMAVAPAGNYNVVTKRIYVQVTDANGTTAFQLWASVPVAQTSYSAVLDLELLASGDELEQPTLLPPRSDLFGLMLHPGNFGVAFSGKLICRSEVERMHGWPDAYEDPVETDILGGAIVDWTTFVCAKGRTYKCTANDPANWQIDKMAIEPCVSSRSIAVGDGAMFYAAADGAVACDRSGAASLVTADKKLLSRKQWAAYKPESMLGVYWDKKYLVFYDTGSAQGGLLFDFDAQSLTRLDFHATAAFVDPRRTELYLQIGNDIVKFEGGAGALTALWRSKEWRTESTAMIAGRVEAEGYPVTMRVYGDGALRATATVADRGIFSLPADPFARRWHFEIETQNEVTAAGIAEDQDELRDDSMTDGG